ncbi:hypothetical protein AXG93_3472s1000 [Marchantia polymorpha subsp. ruderalis]|uniref:Protein kinase domain-containing protein n=1 Tax=Marchantia polymorpha subsp. ruderalis TaxID=1480154 RepID=A0A176WPM4_MARPO|nr:hypothetical protein AXG93_3472s1000 [Marchantia polymorpha subsp. ruderalis]
MGLNSARPLLSIILFCLVLLASIPPGSAALPDEEITALEIMRDTFNLGNWTGDPCDTVSWITCSGAATNVETINLTSRNLTGSIPPEFSNMKAIRDINVSFCALTGTIPDFKTSGGIEILNLQSNDFGGTLGVALFQHGFLREVNLSGNPKLTGTIPSLNQADDIENLALQNNRLTSMPLDLGALAVLNTINVDNNEMVGTLPNLPSGSSQNPDGSNLQTIIFSNNRFSGEIPSSWTELTYVREIILTNNNLSGPIPDGLGLLTNLQILDVRNNHFSGTVPQTFAALPNLKTLLLDNNTFTGIPEVLANKNGLEISFANNPNIEILADPEASKSSNSVGVIIGVVVAVLVIGIGITVWAVMFRRRRKRKSEGGDQVSKEDMPESAQSFTLKEIKAITNDYKTVIGKGGFGPVYLGRLPDGKEVAVKVRASDSKQGADEFLNEVRLLSRLHHRNLVSLIGYCLEAQQQILLYVYMPQGTLQDHLFQKASSNPSTSTSDSSIVSIRETLSWKKRLDIAINAGRGLEYLHKDCRPPVIHRDVKSANILLTNKLLAKVADLGISKQAPELDADKALVNTGVSTMIKGTFGYLDPEYYERHRLTTKSDVYSFGMVLLEIITGKKPQTARFPGSKATTLTEWVRDAVNTDQIESIVDPSLRKQYVREGMIKVAETALQCQLLSGAQRPEMGDVVRALTQALQLEGEDVDTGQLTDDDDDNYQGTYYEDAENGLPRVPFSSVTGSSTDTDTASIVSNYPHTHTSWNTLPR